MAAPAAHASGAPSDREPAPVRRPAARLGYAILPGPWGPIHVGASEEGIVALELLTPTDAFVSGLERRHRRDASPAGSAPAELRSLLERAAAQVEAFLAGRGRGFDLPVRLDGVSAWDRAVLEGVRQVPYGAVTSYGRLARLIGRPGAARAVGGAVGRNPIGLVVPCHRVIAGDGTLGGYGGDWFGSREQLLEVKRELLAIEGTTLPPVTMFA